MQSMGGLSGGGGGGVMSICRWVDFAIPYRKIFIRVKS